MQAHRSPYDRVKHGTGVHGYIMYIPDRVLLPCHVLVLPVLGTFAEPRKLTKSLVVIFSREWISVS